jgi:serine/threonine-protein kinase
MADQDLLAGRYRPLRLIGTGGMARVFLAEDERLGRRVAVKRLHAHSPEEMARRFQREARIGASLNHANLVSVFDVDTDGESVLIVMEYVEGPTLAEELKARPMKEARVASIVEDIAGALDHAHAEGVVHRDVKPANILLRRDGTAKLADLGIAIAAEHTQITASGTVLGTAAYMAPEQLEGGEVGQAADVYSLAAVAFEALSGQKARAGDTPMAVAHQVVSEAPPDLTDVRPDADPSVAAVLVRGMSLRPEDRQHRAGELAAELRATLERAPRPAPVPAPAPAPVPAPAPAPPPEADPLPSPARPVIHRTRKAWLPAAAALVALLLVAGAAFALTRGGEEKATGASTTPKAQAPRTDTGTTPRTEAQAPPTAGQEGTPGSPQTTTPGPSGTSKPASGGGAQLNRQGFALMNRGDYDGAIPILQKAVASYPTDSKDLDYGFALYNLGRSLRLAGRPAEAVPILERRLAIPNQTKTVTKELEEAKKAAQ